MTGAPATPDPIVVALPMAAARQGEGQAFAIGVMVAGGLLADWPTMLAALLMVLRVVADRHGADRLFGIGVGAATTVMIARGLSHAARRPVDDAGWAVALIAALVPLASAIWSQRRRALSATVAKGAEIVQFPSSDRR